MIETISAKVGDIFEVKLESNPTTGYIWEILTPPASVESISFMKVYWVGKSSLFGASKLQCFTFSLFRELQKSGESRASYNNCW